MDEAMGAIDTFLTSVIMDFRTGQRHHSDKELFGQGIGNFFSGIFCGLLGAGATVCTLVNIETGEKTGFVAWVPFQERDSFEV